MREEKNANANQCGREKLIHTIATTDEIMLVLKFSYENYIKAKHALIQVRMNRITFCPYCTKNSE